MITWLLSGLNVVAKWALATGGLKVIGRGRFESGIVPWTPNRPKCFSGVRAARWEYKTFSPGLALQELSEESTWLMWYISLWERVCVCVKTMARECTRHGTTKKTSQLHEIPDTERGDRA